MRVCAWPCIVGHYKELGFLNSKQSTEETKSFKMGNDMTI